MVKDAEANAEADKKRRSEVENKNNLEALIHSTEKSLAEHGEKLGAAEKGEVEGALEAARTAREGSDAETMKQATDRLSAASMKIGEALYRAQQQAEAASAGANWALFPRLSCRRGTRRRCQSSGCRVRRRG